MKYHRHPVFFLIFSLVTDKNLLNGIILMSLPLSQHQDPVFNYGRRIVRYFTLINSLVLCGLIILVNKFGFDWKFFWYEYSQLKFLFLMTFLNYAFAFSVAVFFFFSKKDLTISTFYRKRMEDIKSGAVDASFWDVAGSSLGYDHIKSFAFVNIIFLSSPIIFGLLFIFPSLLGTLAVLVIVSLAQYFLIPAVVAIWIFIFGGKK